MPTTTQRHDTPRSTNRTPAKPRAAKTAGKGPPLNLKTDEDVKAYLSAHLTPVRYGPKGQPIYAHEDLAKLNVLFRGEALF
jgi:hypothetical protein